MSSHTRRDYTPPKECSPGWGVAVLCLLIGLLAAAAAGRLGLPGWGSALAGVAVFGLMLLWRVG